MRNFNLAVLEGRLVSDPELSYTQSGTARCVFSIANNQAYYRDNQLQEEVYFFDVTTWAGLAETCSEYLKKGKRVLVNGRLKQSKWQDQQGINRSRIGVIGNQVHFLDLKKDVLQDDMEESRETVQEETPF
ncbi:MAG: single-stranded DNA-binding protein [Spirochaetota bacterium]